jgi:pimeloyl-ACP methyl ester carboxylesterase
MVLAYPIAMKRARVAAFVLVLIAAGAEAAAQERQIEVAAGERLRVVEAGRGSTVVLLPGLLGSAFGFRKLIVPLVERGHRVIVVEPLGFGGSAKPRPADYSLTAQADRIANVLEVMDVDQAVVVAHAVGASMALRLASRHPERVAAIVSLDGGPAEAAATPGLRRAMRFAFLIRLFGGMGRIRGAVRSTLKERSADPSWVTDEVVEGYMAAAGADVDGTVRALRQMAKAREPELLVPRLPEVRCPVRLVIGEAAAARGISGAEIKLLTEGLASFSIQRVPRAGHFLFEEEPQAVLAAVDRAFTTTRAEGDSAIGQGR